MSDHSWAAARQEARSATALRYPLARPYRLSLDSVAQRCGLHPELVRRFVTLSLVEASRDSAGELWFTADAPTTVARVQRLRTGLCLNYPAIGLVLDLLDRIDALETALRRAGVPRPLGRPTIEQARSDSSWT